MSDLFLEEDLLDLRSLRSFLDFLRSVLLSLEEGEGGACGTDSGGDFLDAGGDGGGSGKGAGDVPSLAPPPPPLAGLLF